MCLGILPVGASGTYKAFCFITVDLSMSELSQAQVNTELSD